jgi:hypothetical protein
MHQTRIGLARFAVAALLLHGCGGGGGGEGDGTGGTPGDGPDAPAPDVPAPPTVEGFVVDGPVAGATVDVLDAAGNRVARGTTDAAGAYAIEVPESTTYPITLRATGGTDLITDEPSDFELMAVITDPAQATAVLTPHTTLLVRRAECAALAAGRSPDAARGELTPADASALEAWGFGLDGDDLAALFDGTVDASSAGALLMAAEAFSETIRRTVTALEDTDAAMDGDGLIEALACDLADDALDGTGSGASTRATAAFQVASAEVLAELVQGRLRVGGSDVAERIDQAVEAVFGGTSDVAALELGAPVLAQFRRATLAAIVASGDAQLIDLLDASEGISAGASRRTVDETLSDPEALGGFAAATAAVTGGDATVLGSVIAAAPPTTEEPPVPRIAGNAFVADPPTLPPLPDASTTLSWRADDAVFCRRTTTVPGTGWDGEGAAEGALVVTPGTETTAFELACAGPGGVTTASLRVLIEPTIEIGGVVLDGPVADAEVVLFDADGNRLFGTLTDGNGRFAVTLPQTLDYFPITLRSEGGTDLLRDEEPAFPELATVLQGPAPNDLVLGLHSTLLVRRAECTAADEDGRRLARNALTDDAASALAPYAFGLDPSTLGTILTRAPTTDAGKADLLLANEALGEALRRGAGAFSSLGRSTDPDALLDALACDLGNGVLDGAEGALDVPEAALLQLAMADVLRETVVGALSVARVDVTARLNEALAGTFGVPGGDVRTLPLSDEELDQLRRGMLAAGVIRPDAALFAYFDALQGVAGDDTRAEAAAALAATPLGTALESAAAAALAIPGSVQQLVLAGTDPEAPATAAPTVDVRVADGFVPVLATRGGETTRLEWSSTDALRCLRSGAAEFAWDGPAATASNPASGIPAVDPRTPFESSAVDRITDFTVQCIGPGGVGSGTQPVLVPPSATISLSASAANLGDTVVATYAFEDATGCSVLRNGSPVLDVPGDGTGAGAGSVPLTGVDVGDSVVLRCAGRTVAGAGTAAGDDSPIRSLAVRAARLTWAEPTQTVAGDPIPAGRCVEKYRIYPSTSPGARDLPVVEVLEPEDAGAGVADGVCETPPPLTATVDLSAQAGRVVYFEVTAVDDDGRESGFSNTLNKIIAR